MELTVCLTSQAQIDRAAYVAAPLPWRTRRSWPHRADWWGELILDERGWGLRAEGDPEEPIWSLSLKLLRPGAYVTLHRPNGEELVFRIVQVEQD